MCRVQIVLPDSANPPAAYNKMAGAYIDGMNLMMPLFKVWTIKSVLAINYWAMGKPSGFGNLSFPDKLRFISIRILFLMLRWAPGFERISSFLLLLVFKLLPDMSSEPVTCPRTGAVARGSWSCPGSKQGSKTAPETEASITGFVLGIKVLVFVMFVLQLMYLAIGSAAIGLGARGVWELGVMAHTANVVGQLA